MRTTDNELMTTTEAARFLGLREATLRTWRWAGTGPTFIRLSPRCIRYAPEDLRQWARSNRVEVSR